MSRRSTGGRVRGLVALGLSVGAGLLAVGVVATTVGRMASEVELRRGPPLERVVVTAHDVWQGKTLEVDDLAMAELPPEYIPAEALRTPEQSVGRVPRERILAHEFVRAERLADAASGMGLVAIVPRGMRAVTLDVGDGSAVSGFLNPGNYVDVLVTLPGETAETVTLLQAITVLAVDRRLGEGEVAAPGRPSVTLAVTPEQAERVTHAVAQGEVTLTLRSDIDVTELTAHGAVTSDLLGTAPDRADVGEWVQRNAEGAEGMLLLIHGPASEVGR
jgi:pilus assembly protein CpaB